MYQTKLRSRELVANKKRRLVHDVSCVFCMGCYSAFMGVLESVKKGNPFLLQSLCGRWMGCLELMGLKSRLVIAPSKLFC